MDPLGTARPAAGVPAARVSWPGHGSPSTGSPNVQPGNSSPLAADTDRVSPGRSEATLLERIGYRLTPAGYVRKLDRLLSLAGRPASLPLGRVLAAKPLLGLVGALARASTSAPLRIDADPQAGGNLCGTARLFHPRPPALQQGPGTPEGHAAGTGQHPGPDAHFRGSRAGLRGSHGARRRERQGTTRRGTRPDPAGHAGGPEPPRVLPGARGTDQHPGTAQLRPGRRPGGHVRNRRQHGCFESRRRSCGSSVGSEPRRRQ